MEIKFSNLDESLQEAIKDFLGDGEDSPNWDYLDEIFLSIGGGATNYNVCIIQNMGGWILGELPLKLPQYR